MQRRTFLGAATAAAALPLGARGDTFPSKPITIVVPVTAGGPSDVMTRIIANKLSEELKVPVVVENRTGAAGVVGLVSVINSRPDGYTLIMAGANVLAILPNLDTKLSYDVARDIEPVTLVSKTALGLFINPRLPVKTVAELVAYAKANPGKLTYASAGMASTAHLSAELLSNLAGIEMTHIPYRGSAAAVNDMTGGRVDLMFDGISTMTHVNSGQLRALAVNGQHRLAAYPELPTMAEAGYPGFTIELWFCIVGPKGIPAPVVTTLNAAFAKVLRDPGVIEQHVKQGVELVPTSPAELWAFSNAQSARMRELIKARRITLSEDAKN